MAWLLLKISLDWSVLFGADLTMLFETWSDWVLNECRRRLAPFYSTDKQGSPPLSFFWARIIQCEAPGCGVTVPLIRNLWLSDRKGSERALEIHYKEKSKIPVIRVFQPRKNSEVEPGTVDGMNAHCPNCGKTTTKERVQAQLLKNNGGARNSILIAIVREKPGGRGKEYQSVTEEDIIAAHQAEKESNRVFLELPPSPPSGDTGFRPRPYGITNWADVFTPRQKLTRWIIHEIIEDALVKAEEGGVKNELLTALASCLYVAYSDNSQYHTSLCVWLSQGVTSIFIQGSGVPMRSDFVEGYPLSNNCDGLSFSIRSMQSALHGLNSFNRKSSEPVLASALDRILPDASVDVIFTDPPYYDSIPYAFLSDFFYGLLRLGLKSRLPKEFSALETDKKGEITKNLEVNNGGGVHDSTWYENNMAHALSRARDALVDDGIGSVVFAHKSTEGWESLVSALIRARWVVTASWPILTERATRMRAQGWAALASSVHLECRPRPENAPAGDWAEILKELPRKIRDWVERLSSEGIRGADLLFACIGPALESFSKYSIVETSGGRKIPLSEFLEKVWEIVGRTALEQIVGTGSATMDTGIMGSLEEDARLTALFLWTLQTTEDISATNEKSTAESGKLDDGEEDENKAGFRIPYDVARRIAQPLGIYLENLEGVIIETKKGVVRLLSIRERENQLMGQKSIEEIDQEVNQVVPTQKQLTLFSSEPQSLREEIPIKEAEGSDRSGEPTTLDRVQMAMLFQKYGRTASLRNLMEREIARGPRFLRLANSLSALYPRDSEEKRLIDALLLASRRS